MKMLEESVTVVGPSGRRKELAKLLQRAGVRSEGATFLAKRSAANAVICELPVNVVLAGARVPEDWKTWETPLSERLKYFPSVGSHEAAHILLLSGSTGSSYVDAISSSVAQRVLQEWPWIHFVRTPEDAVAQVVRNAKPKVQGARTVSPLDGIPGLEAVNIDLRNSDGKLDAGKVKAVFGLDTMAELAKAAKISRQALDANPSTPAVIPVLEQLEKVARVRTLPELREAAAFKAWWKRKLPVFEDWSPYEVWKAGEVADVIDLVDSLITGDTRG